MQRKLTDEGKDGTRVCIHKNCHADGKPQNLIKDFKVNKQQHLGRDIYCKKCRSRDRGKYYHNTGK